MPQATVEATFGVRTLTEVIRTFNTSKYDNFFTTLFQQGKKFRPDGRMAEWDELQSSRALAPVTLPTSPSPITNPQTKANRGSAMILAREARLITWDRLFLDRHMGELKDNAGAVIRDELEDMSIELQKTVEYACANVLTTAGLVVNATNIPGSDATFTLTFTPNTYTFTNDWATVGTGIISQEMPAVQANVISASGLPARRAILNDVTSQYLLQNTEVQKFLANQQWAVNFLRSDVSAFGEDPLRGVRAADVTWAVNAYGYQNVGGTFTRYTPSNKVIFLPDDLTQVLGFAEGRVAAPESIFSPAPDVGINGDLRGLVAYAVRSDDPVGVKLIAVRHFLPILMFPKAVTFATVH